MKHENTLLHTDLILCSLNQHLCFLTIHSTVILPYMFRTLEWHFISRFATFATHLILLVRLCQKYSVCIRLANFKDPIDAACV
jgi:hypothetical protein